MALARIITRSQTCSRQLAIDLLARGYAVEIVSPDKIPDTLADLELRVDAGPDDKLVASVEAHNGDRTASLDFVHHLKSPMGDFIRRKPEPLEDVRFAGQPVDFNAEAGFEDADLPSEASSIAPPPMARPTLFSSLATAPVQPELDLPAPEAVATLAVEPPLNESDPAKAAEEPLLVVPVPVVIASVEATQLEVETVEPVRSEVAEERQPEEQVLAQSFVSPEQPAPAPVAAVPDTLLVAGPESVTASHSIVQRPELSPRPSASVPAPAAAVAQPAPQPRNALTLDGWPVRTAVAFVCVLLVAAVLGFGMKHAKTPAQSSSESTASNSDPVSGQTTLNALTTTAPAPAAVTPQTPTVAAKIATLATVVPHSESPVAKSTRPAPVPSAARSARSLSPSTARPHPDVASHHHSDDLIAHDTVTYLDKRFAPAAKSKPKAAKGTATASHSAHHPSSARKHDGGVIAANSVTYLNGKAPAKTAKPDSTVKHFSDNN
jgi:hypothetical protein